MRTLSPKIKSVTPAAGIEGGRISIEGSGFNPDESSNTHVTFGDKEGRVLLISKARLVAQIPEGATKGNLKVQIKSRESNLFDFHLGRKLSAEVNPVDNPIFDREGNLYVTYSGKRGETPPVSVYKISKDGTAVAYLSNIPNATSLAFDRDGNLYVSSRFEGIVYKATPQADVTVFAKELGTPTGLAMNREGFLFVGDRNGRILKISPEGEVRVYAEVPESMVAIHLAFDAEGNLLASSPGLSSYNQVFMIDAYGKIIPLYGGLGRPQGIAVDSQGSIYVCDAKAGDSCIVRINQQGEMKTIVSGPVMIGLAFNRKGELAVTAPDAVYLLSMNGS